MRCSYSCFGELRSGTDRIEGLKDYGRYAWYGEWMVR